MKNCLDVNDVVTTETAVSSVDNIEGPASTPLFSSDKSVLPNQISNNQICDLNVGITLTQNSSPEPVSDDIMTQYASETQEELSQSVIIDDTAAVTFNNSPIRRPSMPSPASPAVLRSHTGVPRTRNHTDV